MLKVKTSEEIIRKPSGEKRVMVNGYDSYRFSAPLDLWLRFLESSVFRDFVRFCQEKLYRNSARIETPVAVVSSINSTIRKTPLVNDDDDDDDDEDDLVIDEMAKRNNHKRSQKKKHSDESVKKNKKQ